jgi:hypothetical protein
LMEKKRLLVKKKCSLKMMNMNFWIVKLPNLPPLNVSNGTDRCGKVSIDKRILCTLFVD